MSNNVIPKGIEFSPLTTLTSACNTESDTSCVVDDITAFPELESGEEGVIVFCVDPFRSLDPDDYEVLTYTGRNAGTSTLSGLVSRAGNSRNWPVGSYAACSWTAHAWHTIRDAVLGQALEADETVTVGGGGDFATINDALEHFSHKKPLYEPGGFNAVIELMPGFEMDEQVIAHKVDLGHITITSGEPYKNISNYASGGGSLTTVTSAGHGYSNGDVVYIKGCDDGGTDYYNGGWTISSVTTDTFAIDCEYRGNPATKGTCKKGHIIKRSAITQELNGSIAAFIARENAVLPTLQDVLFRIDESGSDLDQNGIEAIHNCTLAVRWGGIMYAPRRGVTCAVGCRLSLVYGCFSHAGQFGVRISNESLCNFQFGIARDCGNRGVAVANAYIGMANADVSGATYTGVQATAGASVRAEEVRANGCGGTAIQVLSGSRMYANEAEAKDAGSYGCEASSGWVDVSGADLSGAETHGIYAKKGSFIVANDADVQKGASPSREDLQVEGGSVVVATGVTGGVSQSAGRVSKEGLVFHEHEVSTSYRNKIINGDFFFWQRGTSESAGSGVRFLADRWVGVTGTGGGNTTINMSRQIFPIGQTDVPGSPAFFHRTEVSTAGGSGNLAQLVQRIESVLTLAGRTATLSFWAKADASKNLSVEFVQGFGDGGSGAETGIGVTKVSLTTAWQKFTVTADIPSISGKTVGAHSFLSLNFWLDAGSDFNARTDSLGNQSGTFDLALVQVEDGYPDTPFEFRPIALEEQLCMRYFEKSYRRISAPGTATTLGVHTARIAAEHSWAWFPPVMFSVEKRDTPTVTLYNPSTGSTSYPIRLLGEEENAAGYINYPSNRGFTPSVSNHAVPQHERLVVHWTADAEF